MNPVSRRALFAMSPLALASPAAQKNENQFGAAYQHIDEFIPRYMREWSTPGVALAITDRQKLLRLRSYGFSDAAARTPVTPVTLFQIGSMSKAFVAVAVLQLHQDGKLDLHAPLARYLPWFRIGSKYSPLTIHHVLSHTSGIPGNRDDLPSSLYQAVALSERETSFAPGARFAYSNVGYEVLGQVIEAVAGEPYADYLVKRILTPLGMTGAKPAITNEIRPLVATGYPMYYDDRPPHSSHPLAPGTWVEWGAGDGNIAALATDLTAFLRMLLNGGAGPLGRVLSEESFRRMTARAVKIREGLFYGYGISVRQVDGHTILGHSGGMVGYSGIMLADVDDGVGVVMLSNGAGNPVLAGEFVLSCVRAAAAGQKLPPPPDPPSKIRNAAAYTGTYRSPNGKKLTLSADAEELILQHAGRRVVLERRGEDRFYVNHRDFALFLLGFERESGAVVEAFHGPDWYPGEGFKGPRSYEHPADWNGFPGHYRSYSPWLSNFRIVLRKGKLWFVNPEGDERMLVQVGAGVFQIGELPTAEHLRLDTVVNGSAQRANVAGADYYRTFTP